jgi:hypothetical protein
MLLMCGIAVADQLVAQTVNYKIIVNGQERQLSNQPVTINDRTYLPVRAVAELVGYDVGFDEQQGLIKLDSKQTTVTLPVAVDKKIRVFVNGIESQNPTGFIKNDQSVYAAISFFIRETPIKSSLDSTTKVASFVIGDKKYQSSTENISRYDSIFIPIKPVVEYFGGTYVITETDTEYTVAITIK